MHNIFFYRDRSGNEPVFEYLKELTSKTDKNSRINANKINDYIEILRVYGTQAENPISSISTARYGNCAHCETAFCSLHGRATDMCFASLHQENAENSGTRDREGKKRAFRPVRKGVLIMSNPAIGRSWEDVRTELYTPEEISEATCALP